VNETPPSRREQNAFSRASSSGRSAALAMDQVEPAQPQRGFCQKTCIEFSRRNAALRRSARAENRHACPMVFS